MVHRESNSNDYDRRPTYDRHVFVERPLLSALLFDNVDSDARDHCANERSMYNLHSDICFDSGSSRILTVRIVILAFLSWLRLAIYMAVVSVAILISFHLKSQPTPLERRIALPFGIIFWFLALACLASGTANYIKTVQKYSKRQALVQTGWKTQVVGFSSAYLCVASDFASRSLQL